MGGRDTQENSTYSDRYPGRWTFLELSGAAVILWVGATLLGSCSKSNDIVDPHAFFTGLVTDSITNQPIGGAMIIVFHQSGGQVGYTYSNAQGKYSADGDRVGYYALNCRKDGYTPIMRYVSSSINYPSVSGINFRLSPQ